MDSNGSSSNDKRKLEDHSDSQSSVKKFCSFITDENDSHNLPEVSTSSIQDLFASSELKEISQQHSDDKLSLLVQTSYLENQSHNICSTTESLDGSQSEVSLNDINIDPFIPTSCETSQTLPDTGVDSSGNPGIKTSSDSEANKIQTSETEMAVPTSTVTLTVEKHQTETRVLPDSKIKNLNFEMQVVSSSDQISCLEQNLEAARTKESPPKEKKVDNEKVIEFNSIVMSTNETLSKTQLIQDSNLCKKLKTIEDAPEQSDLCRKLKTIEDAPEQPCHMSDKKLIISKNEDLYVKPTMTSEAHSDLKEIFPTVGLDNIIDTLKEKALNLASSCSSSVFTSEKNLLQTAAHEANTEKQLAEDNLLIHQSIGKSLPSPSSTEEKMPSIPHLSNISDVSFEETLPSFDASKPILSITESVKSAEDDDHNKTLTFKNSLIDISLPQTNISPKQTGIATQLPLDSELKSQVSNVDPSFMPIIRPTHDTDSLAADIENELDKKSEISAMEVDSTNTPAERSLVDTPCDSGETSPCLSTPADSCQVSAAPSPILKEGTNMASESLIYDESSIDTKDLGEDSKETEEIRPIKVSKKGIKKKALETKKSKGKTIPVLVDEETRMSANGTSDIGIDEDSQSSTGTSSKREVRRYRCEVIVPESTEIFTANKVNEYLWPLDGMGEHYFIQEHIAQYLGVMSFKRKYPDLRRRAIESQEKEYLKDLGMVSEIACDLGLTAVRSEDVLDVIFNDFPSKYEELQRVLRERKEKFLKEKGKVEYQVVNLDKSKMQEYSRKAALNSCKWNVAFNRERSEERRYSFDLQSFTLHIPMSRAVKLPDQMTNIASYPVAVLPGQYTDYCKKYSPGELRAMPLHTVLTGPFTAEELAAEAQGVESDDDSAVASFGTCAEIKEEPEFPPMVDPLSAEKQPRCKNCNGGRARNKDGKPEPLIICGTCRTASHPTCIDLTLTMIDKIESYSWQCMDCKTCAQCNDPDDEERMIFCDMCDRGYHIYCVGLRKVPNGRWHCKECAICFTCAARNPAGNEHIKNAEWQHEFKKDKDNKQLKYTCTLCVPCDKYWKRRQFCSVCMKVYRSIPEDGMVRCSGCPKYVHKEGCSVVHENERFCNTCFKSRNKTALNHSRIIAAAKKKMATGNVMWK